MTEVQLSRVDRVKGQGVDIGGTQSRPRHCFPPVRAIPDESHRGNGTCAEEDQRSDGDDPSVPPASRLRRRHGRPGEPALRPA
jgi:hypothetical protein